MFKQFLIRPHLWLAETSKTYRRVIAVVVPIVSLMTVVALAWAMPQKRKSKQNVDSKLYMLRYLLVKV